MFKFIIPGEPVAKGRPKLSRYGTYTPKKTKEYEEHIKQEWRKNGYREPLTGAVMVDITFYRNIQKSGSKAVKTAKLTGKVKPTIKPDLDNYIKAVLDGLNGLAWVDDSQIINISATKEYSMKPETVVLIWGEVEE
jgi:Holliday junction resolvase RusA-like endonuclease